MIYPVLKATHVGCVVISGSLFVLRAGMQFAGVEWRRWRLLRLAPHVVDTILLASAISLAILLAQYPFLQAWLTAKVVALIAYIALGYQALNPARSRGSQMVCGLAAILTFAYIVSVALTRQAALGLLSG